MEGYKADEQQTLTHCTHMIIFEGQADMSSSVRLAAGERGLSLLCLYTRFRGNIEETSSNGQERPVTGGKIREARTRDSDDGE
jgi:hypothetical protein